jgi:hypothetical protein
MLTLVTMTREASIDGSDMYGFPFTFYSHFEGKCNNCYNSFGFRPLCFCIDMLLSLVFTYLFIRVKTIFIKLKSHKSSNHKPE